MKKYYVNKNAQSNGDHEVHDQDCTYLPAVDNRKYLGDFLSCGGAVTEAKKLIVNQMAVKHVQDHVIPLKLKFFF